MLVKIDKQLEKRELKTLSAVYKVALHLSYKLFGVCNKSLLYQHHTSLYRLCYNFILAPFFVSKKCIKKTSLIISELQSQSYTIQKYKLFGRNYITPRLLIFISFLLIIFSYSNFYLYLCRKIAYE